MIPHIVPPMGRRRRALGAAALIFSAIMFAGAPDLEAGEEKLGQQAQASTVDEGRGGAYVINLGDTERGKYRFVGKGCVVCHSINGVGGRVGPALDLGKVQMSVDIFNFMARMWQGAATMIVLQEMQLGYQIDLSGQDLADIVSFLADRSAQESFTEADIPPSVRRWMLDEVFDELVPETIPQ